MRKRTLSVIILLIILAAVGGCGSGAGSGEGDQGQQPGNDISQPDNELAVGATAPDFTLQDLSGEEISLAELKGKTVVLTFWETWCPVCNQENPYINELAQKNPGNAVILTVDLLGRDTPGKVRQYMDAHGFDFPVLLDNKGSVGNAYCIYWLPTTFVIDADGVIQYEHSGALPQQEFEQLLQQLD